MLVRRLASFEASSLRGHVQAWEHFEAHLHDVGMPQNEWPMLALVAEDYLDRQRERGGTVPKSIYLILLWLCKHAKAPILMDGVVIPVGSGKGGSLSEAKQQPVILPATGQRLL